MEDLALHILDIAQNSLEAGADRNGNRARGRPGRRRHGPVEVRDNGRGMDADTLAKVTDPFFTSEDHAQGWDGTCRCWTRQPKPPAGAFTIDSKPGQGTTIRAIFQHRQLDRAPLGDIETTLMVLVAGQPDKDIRFRHRINDRIFELDSSEFRSGRN